MALPLNRGMKKDMLNLICPHDLRRKDRTILEVISIDYNFSMRQSYEMGMDLNGIPLSLTLHFVIAKAIK